VRGTNQNTCHVMDVRTINMFVSLNNNWQYRIVLQSSVYKTNIFLQKRWTYVSLNNKQGNWWFDNTVLYSSVPYRSQIHFCRSAEQKISWQSLCCDWSVWITWPPIVLWRLRLYVSVTSEKFQEFLGIRGTCLTLVIIIVHKIGAVTSEWSRDLSTALWLKVDILKINCGLAIDI